MNYDEKTKSEFREYYYEDNGHYPNEEELLTFMDSILKENPKSDSPFKKVLDSIIVFLIIGFMIGFFYCMFTERTILALILFGSIFLVSGICSLLYKQISGIVIAIIGILLIAIPILIINPEIINFTINWDVVLPIMLGLAFFLAGLFVIYSGFKETKSIGGISKNVRAKVIGYNEIDGVIKATKLEYTYDNKKYTLYKPIDGELPSVGSNIDIEINSLNPDKLYNDESYVKNVRMVHIISGAITALMGLGVILLSIFKWYFRYSDKKQESIDSCFCMLK